MINIYIRRCIQLLIENIYKCACSERQPQQIAKKENQRGKDRDIGVTWGSEGAGTQQRQRETERERAQNEGMQAATHHKDKV